MNRPKSIKGVIYAIGTTPPFAILNIRERSIDNTRYITDTNTTRRENYLRLRYYQNANLKRRTMYSNSFYHPFKKRTSETIKDKSRVIHWKDI